MKRLTPKQVVKLTPGSEIMIVVYAVKSDRSEDEWNVKDGGPVWYTYAEDDADAGVEYFLLKKASSER